MLLAASAFSFAAARAHAQDTPARPVETATKGAGSAQTDATEGRGQSYSWHGLLLESFAFISIEDLFRMGSDNTLRSITVEKPFWHDYLSSLRQFNMRRWNDGDDFLVNYVGHPMQGGISGYIEVQNSPRDRRLQWGDRGYWPSRERALLWSTVYSTYSEIGPTGEAGIGNEGGFTYDTQCMLHCNTTTAKPSGKTTNNTGWVDFIVTPTAGTLWMLVEDYLDKHVSQPLRDRDPDAVFPRIVRGSLSPTRTFANALRGRKPWYRDWEYPEVGDTGPAMHFEKAWENAEGVLEGASEWKRLEVAPHSLNFATTVTNSRCHYCVRLTEGYGVETSAKLWRWLYADADVSYQPGASFAASDRAGGNLLMGAFGLRGGYHTPRYAVHLSVRPGFQQFHAAYLTSPVPGAAPSPAPAIGTITHFAWNTMAATDYKLNDHMALRVGVQESLVRYRNACLDGSGIGTAGDLNFLNHGTSCQQSPGLGRNPYFTFLSHQDFVNRGSWGVQFGPVFSFNGPFGRRQ